MKSGQLNDTTEKRELLARRRACLSVVGAGCVGRQQLCRHSFDDFFDNRVFVQEVHLTNQGDERRVNKLTMKDDDRGESASESASEKVS